MAKKKSVRRSLTRAQILSGAGAELLVLCETVTEDGSLNKEEILALRSWLLANKDAGLPAIDFLVMTLERIIADRIITREERRELYQAIESVLPTEARRKARTSRKSVESARKQQANAELSAKKEQQRAERERDRRLCGLDFMVAGVHYEGRSEIVARFAAEGDTAFLVRDRQNQFSRNAIEVRLPNGMVIGYVPEEDAIAVAPLFDQGCPQRSTVKKILTGGRVPIPVIKADVHRPDARVEGLIFEPQVPTRQAYVPQRWVPVWA
jgi:hypothetical protein